MSSNTWPTFLYRGVEANYFKQKNRLQKNKNAKFPLRAADKKRNCFRAISFPTIKIPQKHLILRIFAIALNLRFDDEIPLESLIVVYPRANPNLTIIFISTFFRYRIFPFLVRGFSPACIQSLSGYGEWCRPNFAI